MPHPALRLGFIGGAPNSAAGRAHYTACRMDGLWVLEAGCFSRRGEINREAASLYGVAEDRIHESAQALLENEAGQLDAVAILTPTPDHAEMVRNCLEAGMPVICEKALSMTSAEAAEIDELRKKHKGYLAVIYNYSGYPMVRQLRRMIRDGELGEVLHFQAEMPQEGYLRTDSEGNKPSPQDWRQKDGPIPTLHLDLAVHLHELVHYLTGLDPLEVVADQASRGWFPVVDQATALCKYTENVQGQFWFSKCALGHRNGLRIRIYGSKASAEWHQFAPEEILLSHADGRREIIDRGGSASLAGSPRYTRFKAGHPAGFNEALANLYADIHEDLHHFKQTGEQTSEEVYGSEFSTQGLRWLEAMTRSCQTGQWEKVQSDE